MRNADLDDLKDEQYAEKVKQERKEVEAMPKTQTTNYAHTNIARCDLVECADNLVHLFEFGIEVPPDLKQDILNLVVRLRKEADREQA